MTDSEMPASSPPHRDGPNLGILAVVALALTIAGLAISAALSGGAILASPFGAATDVAHRYHEFWLATRVSAWLQFGSAVPLGIYAATAYARLQRLGVRVPGPGIGFFGGTVAATMLMTSALTGWVLSRPEVTGDAALTQALSFFSFITGSAGFVVGMGLLIAGIAVPALILRLTPRWLAVAGLVIAALAELSFLAMIIEPLQFLFPIGRFLGLIWILLAGVLLPRRRVDVARKVEA